jgi:hypothetical protein
MSRGFDGRRVLADLAATRDILRRRAQRIAECGGDPTVTADHLEGLARLESLLCGSTDVHHLCLRLAELESTGRTRIAHAELFTLLTVKEPCAST